jgi:hypothetical protein
MPKKRQSKSRAHRVAIRIGSALGSLQARLDRLNATEIKDVLARAQSMLAALGPNTSGDEAPRRNKAAELSGRPRRKGAAKRKAAPRVEKKK